MIDKTSFLGLILKNRSVLASGILGVSLSSLKRVYKEGAGLVTTKSIGLDKRKGHNAPVVYNWGNGLINAVGLSNPGIDNFVKNYDNNFVDFPIIISIFGTKTDDFPAITERLKALKFDFLELNISCPNVLDEFGAPFSFSPEISYSITKSVKDIIDKPVILKLSPNTPNLLKVAKSVENAGASALCIINTVGPGMVINTNTGMSVLGNKVGGVSGDAILPLTVKAVYELYEHVKIPIIGTGGISSVDGALQVLMAGASLFGIGSAVLEKGIEVFKEIVRGIEDFLLTNSFKTSDELIGLSHRVKNAYYFTIPEKELTAKNNFTVLPVSKIVENKDNSVRTILFNSSFLKIPEPGQFYMIWIPDVDQKPYSVSYYDKNYIGFSLIKKGPFSKSLFKIKRKDPIGLLGPSGKGFDLSYDKYLLVGGGVGLAPLIYTAITLIKKEKKVSIVAAGKSSLSVLWINSLFKMANIQNYIDVIFITEDGSIGKRGLVSDYLDHVVKEIKPDFCLVCGPELMIEKSIEILKNYNINGEASIERMMKCGIGICGSCCLDNTGDRVCTEGPVFNFEYIEKLKEFGKYKRDSSGSIERLT